MAFGVVGGSADDPLLGYLAQPLPAEEAVPLAGAVKATKVLRFAAPCVEDACQHFDGADCRLVTKITQLLPAVVDRLPACRVRHHCRRWLQESRAACYRCPQIHTEPPYSEALALAADPRT